MDKKRIFILLAIILMIAVAFYVNSQFTINFGFLGNLFLVAVIALPAFYHFMCSRDVGRRADPKNKQRTLGIGIFDNRFGFLGAVVLLVLGWFCIKTLNNYFYADKHVYRNIDHHAVHFSGVRILQPNGFILADNTKNSFFDNDHNNGKAVITGVNDTAVSVRLTGFTRPIYFNRIDTHKRCYRQDLANMSSLASFKEGEHLFLRMKNGDVYDFNIGNVTTDSVEYWLKLPNGEKIKTEEDRFLIRGLPLSKLTRHPSIQDVDFAGIHIVRESVHPLVKQKEKIEKYANVRYCVEVQHISHHADDNYVVALKAGEESEWRSVKAPTDITIQIPFETTFVIGYDGSSSRPAYFTRNHSQAQSHLALLYRLPIYHYFEQTPDKSFNNVCVTTSLGSFMDNIDAMPENILLFDAFQHMDNINNMAPMTVSYVSGPTNQLLDFIYTTADGKQRVSHAGESFENIQAPRHHGVAWIAGIEDMKQTSPYQPQDIKWYIVLFTLALAILLFIGSHSVKDQQSAARNTFTTLEFVAYAVTLYLVTFRWFLLWRTSVFLPVENINYYEFYGIFRNEDNYSNLLLVMVGFVLIVFVAKIIIRYIPRLTEWSLPDCLPIIFQKCYSWIQIVLTLLIFGFCLVFRHSSPWLIISLPIWTYILNSIIITKRFAGFYRKDDRGWDDLNLKDPPAKLFIWSLINAIVTSGILLIIDSGFGILFFTFTLFWLSWLLHEHVTHYLPNQFNVVRNLLVLFVFLLMLILVASYKNVIGLMYYNTFEASAIMCTIGAIIGFSVPFILQWGSKTVRLWYIILFAFLFFLIPFGFKAYVSGFSINTMYAALIMGVVGFFIAFTLFYFVEWKSKAFRIWCIVLFTFIFFLMPIGYKAIISNFSINPFRYPIECKSFAAHTAQRVVVHFDQPENVMANIDDELTEYRFLQAALNHMIIGEYSCRGENVKLWGEHGHGYFKMQPHSRIGAMWNAQLTDISLVRFVIAEHSPWLPFFIMIPFFLLMTVWAVRQPLYRRWTRAVLIQIPLLLMVQSLLIWMATTQRFIFLGQDFPMVSINSRLTLVYYFSLIIIWLVTAIYSKVTFVEVYSRQYNNDLKDSNGLDRNSFRYIIARNDMYKVFLILVLCMVMGYLAPKGKSEPSLKLTELMERFGKDIERVNERLKEYQDVKFKNKKRRLDGCYQGSLNNLTAFMQEFNQKEQIDSIFADFPFGQRLWSRFVNEDSRSNNMRQVLHAHLNSHHQLELKTINAFYNRELPQLKENEWRGNLVAISDTVGVTRNSVVDGNLRAYRLPASWLTDGEEKALVSSIGAPILGSEPNFVMQRGIRCAAVLGPGISVVHPNSKKLKSIVQEKRYLARNVIVNGHRTMFYPMGESLYWMSQLATELRIQRDKIPEDAREADFNADVELTLKPDLNNELFDILRKEGANRSSVIVANGDGEVWALPSSDRIYQLNPNDHKQIASIVDSLELYGLQGSGVARRIFGNQNLMNLPFGPGSSQKPLVWTAVASQVEYAHWDSLRVCKYSVGPNGIESIPGGKGGGGKFKITHFNGMSFYPKKPFMPLQSDERRGEVVSLHDYMTYSSNVYNAVMAYIGSFCDFDLSDDGFKVASDYDGQSLFAKWSGALSGDNYIMRFPLLSTNGHTIFTLNRRIISDDQPSSIINLSLNDMFFRCQNEGEIRQDMYANPAYGLLQADDVCRHVGYAFLERSKFDSRQGKNEYEFMENAIRSTAIGAAKVWYVTPWKMAEAYGRMASLNRNLHLNIVKQKKQLPYESFARLTDGYWHARPEQMKGLSDVLLSGTGKSVGTNKELNITEGGKNASNHVGDYFLYAKTGTIGKGDHHRFGVIISNTDLITANEDALKKARYVTLYFAFSDNDHMTTYAKVIRRVMDSTEFKQYMKPSNK